MMAMPAPKEYPPGLRERAVRLGAEGQEKDPELSLSAAVARVGRRVGVNAGTLRAGASRPRSTRANAPGTTTSAARRWGAEVRELKRANEILVGGLLVLRAGARPATAVVIGFIDYHRDRFGVEPICRVLTAHAVPIAPSGYSARSRPGRR